MLCRSPVVNQAQALTTKPTIQTKSMVVKSRRAEEAQLRQVVQRRGRKKVNWGDLVRAPQRPQAYTFYACSDCKRKYVRNKNKKRAGNPVNPTIRSEWELERRCDWFCETSTSEPRLLFQRKPIRGLSERRELRRFLCAFTWIQIV